VLQLRRTAARVVAVLLLAATAAGAGQPAERRFLSGYAGTLPPQAEDRAGTYFKIPEVRALLARLETGGIPFADASSALPTRASLEDLLRVGILRREGDRVAIGFAYFTPDSA
jgi:hypothetical protein